MRYKLILLFLLLNTNIHAQNEIGLSNYHFIGVKLGVPIYDKPGKDLYYNFIELAFGKIENEKFSYQILLGIEGYKNEGPEGNVDIGVATTGQIRDTYFAKGYYIKPCFILAKKLGPIYSNFLSANFNMTLTQHYLEIKTTDPVYGDKYENYSNVKIDPFSSVELEHCNIINIGNRIDFNVVYHLGLRILEPHQFNDVLKGYGSKANFVPGTSNNTSQLYFNLMFGINVHLF